MNAIIIIEKPVLLSRELFLAHRQVTQNLPLFFTQSGFNTAGYILGERCNTEMS